METKVKILPLFIKIFAKKPVLWKFSDLSLKLAKP